MLLFLFSAVSCAQATEESLKELQRCVSPAIFNDAYIGRQFSKSYLNLD